jgi:uncharacterized protein (TIGR03435 family)
VSPVVKHLLVFLICVLTSTLAGQQPAPVPAFEVASVKLDPKQDRGGPRKFDEITMPPVQVLPGGRVESYGWTLSYLIGWAYGLAIYQKIEGTTADVLETEVIISAKAAAPSLTSDEAKAMMRTLLEQRFQMRWRLRPREVDGYALVPAREDGRPAAGLRPFAGDCAARAQNDAVSFTSPDYEQKARCQWNSGYPQRHRGVGVSMTAVAERLSLYMATPVSDRTGWAGLFTFDITADVTDLPFQAFAPRPSGLGAPRPRPEGAQLLDVFGRELGLKLVKEPATINDFVIEGIGPLIEN